MRTRAELASFLEAALVQTGRSSLPFVSETYSAPERLVHFDRHCEAFTTNHVANRASRSQGRAFFSAAIRVFQSVIRDPRLDGIQPPFGHLAPVFGAVVRWLGLDGRTAAQMFLFNHVRGLLAGAVRLNIVGPMEAQVMQYQLAQKAESVREQCAALTLDDLALTTPLLDIWQSAQDRLYSRLFQS